MLSLFGEVRWLMDPPDSRSGLERSHIRGIDNCFWWDLRLEYVYLHTAGQSPPSLNVTINVHILILTTNRLLFFAISNELWETPSYQRRA